MCVFVWRRKRKEAIFVFSWFSISNVYPMTDGLLSKKIVDNFLLLLMMMTTLDWMKFVRSSFDLTEKIIRLCKQKKTTNSLKKNYYLTLIMNFYLNKIFHLTWLNSNPINVLEEIILCRQMSIYIRRGNRYGNFLLFLIKFWWKKIVVSNINVKMIFVAEKQIEKKWIFIHYFLVFFLLLLSPLSSSSSSKLSCVLFCLGLVTRNQIIIHIDHLLTNIDRLRKQKKRR